MNTTEELPYVLLIPGAWMASWIWEPTAESLRRRGIDAEAITLAGLEPGTPEERVGQVRLEDHVIQVLDHLARRGSRRVVLVGHSYSGMVVGQVADRLGQSVASVHFASFLPRDGRSLLDDWGPDDAARAQERAEIVAAAHLWAPPPRAALDLEKGLSPDDRGLLAARFTPHPGRTVLDPAKMRKPVTSQEATFVATSEADVPAILHSAAADDWDIQILDGGHWAMLEQPEAVAALVADRATRHRGN
ncbi:alpha/beta hydrolase [Tessaracoccus sp. OS52]|uniref:alpha/beta fold hydrolase n=1 Tax=Tessaracoccus sp. OS52 TaxID=2886691 RepID=UPI001D1176A6|nr:alpha/beta hydrolase [Tessaracoccus sp. OS52]MCC2594280.1 alpha/beta hydrolase [Tessaracoccus sp. OS52]